MVDSSLFINQHDYFFNSETTALNFPAFVRGISSTYSNFTFMVGALSIEIYLPTISSP